MRIEKLEGILSVRIPKSLLNLLEDAKWALRKSKNEIVRMALIEYIERHVPKEKEQIHPQFIADIHEALKEVAQGKVEPLERD